MKIVTCVLTKCLKWTLIPDSVCRILGYETSFDQRSWDTRFPSTKDSGVWSSPQSRILGYQASFNQRSWGYEPSFDQRSWGMKLPSTLFPSSYTCAKWKCTNEQWTMSPRKKGGLDIHDIVGGEPEQEMHTCPLILPVLNKCCLSSGDICLLILPALNKCCLCSGDSCLLILPALNKWKHLQSSNFVVELWLKSCHGSLSTHTHPSSASPFPSLPQFSLVCLCWQW